MNSGRIDLTHDWRKSLTEATSGRKIAIVASAPVVEIIGRSTLGEAELILVTDGEGQKSWSEVISVIRRLGEIAFPRDGVIVGIGGGATTDLAGFVASIWMRGVDWIALPTTLAGMVDAAIGGKTGINSESGKNLVGSFHLPLSTIIDQRLLDSLSRRDLSAGLAEVIKCGFIADERILDLVESLTEEEMQTPSSSERIGELIGRAASVKDVIVREDLRESGRRAFLNYGHTLGHAIEKSSEYILRHGEAVSIGLVFAAHLSHRLNGLPSKIVDRHIELLTKVGLPTDYPTGDLDHLLELMALDKKVKDGKMRFVTLKSIGEPVVSEGVSTELVREIYSRYIDTSETSEKE